MSNKGSGISLKGLFLNGAVAAAVVTGVLSIYGTWFAAEQKLQTQLVLNLLDHDRENNRNVVSAFRTLSELGVLDSVSQQNWDSHTINNAGSLPRFYHSGFIWSIFHSNVDDIKRAYKELGLYEGEVNRSPGGAFVLATLRFQHDFCVQHSLRPDCTKHADGIVGKGTVLEISRAMEAIGKRLVFD